jgi:uncharacterized protein YigA (DUF484 family)
MSTREARGLAPTTETEEESVARYLQHNPDFFERHQPLLSRLRLPHARSGSTISLVERQVEVLREKHAAIEEKLADFVSVARSNDAIADRMHRFTRRLLRAGSRERVLQNIEAGLRQDFDSFNSVLLLIGHEQPNANERFLRVLPPDDPHLKSFETLFANGKPRCGQVRDSQRELLFGSEANDIGSVALVPLGEKGSLGLLALGSNERDRFHPGMSTEFLGRLAELISDALTAP